MRTVPTYRGQPLVALIALLGGWVVLRVVAWEAAGTQPPTSPPVPVEVTSPRPSEPRHVLPPTAAPTPDPRFTPPPAPPRAQPWPRPERLQPMPRAVRSGAKPHDGARPVPVGVTSAHQLLWMAALSQMPLPAIVSAPPTSPTPGALPQGRSRVVAASRWSADGWLLLRRGGTVAPAGGFSPATYGASQVGAVVRYRLAPQSAHRPAAYLRGSAALNGSHEREAALGIAARPIAGLPVVLAAEARVNVQPSGTRLRPAAFAYTEMAPMDLPLRMRSEFYLQAGYVGGNFASAFADGQLRVDRRLVRLGRGDLRAGGGIWGGAQRGASRLDIGPSAVIGMPVGDRAGARLGIDWRFRVAGNAAPSSGPAVTLSAGF